MLNSLGEMLIICLRTRFRWKWPGHEVFVRFEQPQFAFLTCWFIRFLSQINLPG